MRFEAIPAKHFRNKVTKAVASIYGALPYTDEADQANWIVESAGWTIRDNQNNTVGFGLVSPFVEESEARHIADDLESAAAAAVLRHWLPRSFPGKPFTVHLGAGSPTGVLVLWKHTVRPSEVERTAATIIESAGLGMAVTAFSHAGMYAKLTLMPSRGSRDKGGVAANDGEGAEAA